MAVVSSRLSEFSLKLENDYILMNLNNFFIWIYTILY